MKLWMILYTATGIGGTWGPLPYDLAECEQRQAAMMAELAEKGPKKPEVWEDAKRWRLACEFHAERPKNAD